MGLVLTRELGQSIMVGDTKITVCEITYRSDQAPRVRLFIEADKAIPVHRLEVYEKIQRADEAIRRGEADAP